MKNVNERRVGAFSNMIWRFAERTGAQLVSFVVTMIIARILDPQAYGTVAIISVFTTILFVFVDSGLGNALIQKKDADNVDFSTVFYLNIIFCIVLYLLLFACAPFIASFYSDPQMISLIRVSGLILIVSSVKNVQQAYVSKKMLFKKFFYATLAGTVGAAIVGIVMALAGYGVWALVISGLFNNIVDTFVLWITVRWRPEKVFSFERLKSLFSFGSRLLAANVIQVVYSNMYQLIIGKLYTSADLAYYDRGKQIPALVTTNIDDSINSVLLPVLSESQDDKKDIKGMTKRALKMNMYVMTPFLIGIAAIAEPLIKVLLTEKWLGAVVYLEIFCVYQTFRPIATANLNAIKAMGRSDLFFKLEIWKDITGIIILLLTMKHGVLAISLGVLGHSFLGQIINTSPSKKLFDYGLWEQIKDIIPTLFLVGIMFVVVYPIKYIGLNNILILVIQVVLGMTVYILGSSFLRIETFYYVIDLAKDLLKRKKNEESVIHE